jgi:hypothetical protein
MAHLAQTVHLSCSETNSISKRIETSFHLTLVTQEYHPVYPKQFMSLWYVWRKPSTYHAPKLTLSLKGTKGDSTSPTSPRSSNRCIQNDFWVYGTFGINCAPILNQEKHYFQMDRNELPFERHHLGVPFIVSKTISKPMVCLSQTVDLSCTNTNTISKQTEMRFYMTHIT